jgi:hypothetical protein
MIDPSEPFKHIIPIVASDRCGRYLSRLCSPSAFEEALGLLEASSRPVLVTGFFVPSAEAPETDGPPGTAVLARALERSGRNAVVTTDCWNAEAVYACCRALAIKAPLVAEDPKEILGLGSDLIIFVERLGRACDGRYYNMRGEEISYCTAPLDGAAHLALEEGIPVLAVGDGGNEAGMACLMPEMGDLLSGFGKCLSTVPSTVAVPVDVSNWGAYALACLLSCREKRWLGHTLEEEKAMLEAMAAAGAVDGVTGKNEPSVDGMGIEEHVAVVEDLRKVFEVFMSSRGVIPSS